MKTSSPYCDQRLCGRDFVHVFENFVPCVGYIVAMSINECFRLTVKDDKSFFVLAGRVLVD